jgi:hypothetical protein
VTVLRLVAVHDTGNMINPLLVDANLHMDYTCPTAADVPAFQVGHVETPSPFNPLGAKGAGESGVGGPLGAVVSAVENALRPLGIRGAHPRDAALAVAGLAVHPERLGQRRGTRGDGLNVAWRLRTWT